MIKVLVNRIARSAAARLPHYAREANRKKINLELRDLNLANAPTIQTWTTRAQLETLYRLAADLPANANVVEVGSYLGASTCYLAAGVAARGGTVTAIDLWNNETIPGGPRDTFEEFKRNTAGVSHLLRIVRKRTQDLTPEDVRPPVHLAFIDADHSYEATRSDASFLAPLMSPDGIIAFHDTATFAGVGRVLGEMLTGGDWCLGGHTENLSWIRRANWSPWPLPGKDSATAKP